MPVHMSICEFKIKKLFIVIDNKDKMIHARFLFSPKKSTHNVKIKGSWDNWREFTQMK